MASEQPPHILFRVWSSDSAGTNSAQGCRSGDQNRRPVNLYEKAQNFENHRKMDNLIPTCFISTTDDPIRALRYAIDLDFKGKSSVQIGVIRSNRYTPAEDFAALIGQRSSLFNTEFLFEWEIKRTEILHVVPLETLVRNGLYKKCRVLDPDTWPDVDAALPPLRELRLQMYNNNEQAWRGGNTWPERSGNYVAAIAICFGCDAPLHAITSLIWERGTHFVPENYWDDELKLRIRDAIQARLAGVARYCPGDEWCGELAELDIGDNSQTDYNGELAELYVDDDLETDHNGELAELYVDDDSETDYNGDLVELDVDDDSELDYNCDLAELYDDNDSELDYNSQ